jgi:Fur family ferric uptake transcriptional regulator
MVLQVLASRPHATADVVIETVREQFGAVSNQGVYDVLNACVAAGIVRRIEPAGSAARYELRVSDNHHHLVCRVCGVVADTDCALGGAPCLEPSDSHGFALDEAEVVFWGVCPTCQTEQRKRTRSANA